MPAPLATLRRGPVLASFYRGPRTASLRFRGHREAVDFLRFWARDASAVFDLRTVLRRALRSGPLVALSDPQVLDLLAACVVDGTLSIGPPEGVAIFAAADEAAAAEQAAASAADAAADQAAIAPAAAPPGLLPIVPPAPPDDVLEALEEVQIEGAEVRPEIEQALAELDVSLANVSLASVSLAPTPTKVDAISASMSDVSGGAVQTIDGL